MLGFSLCLLQPNIGIQILDAVQITIAVIMCLLVAAQFIKESLQMYKATKRFQLNRYMNLLVGEGMIYFLAYVHLFLFLFHQTKRTIPHND